MVLRTSICRNLAGEELSTLGMQELKQLERQLKTGVERIRSKSVYAHRKTVIHN